MLGSGPDQAGEAVAIHWSQVLDDEQVLNREELQVLQDNARQVMLGSQLQKRARGEAQSGEADLPERSA